MHELVRSICEQQSHSGAFLSTVHLPSIGEIEDRNCFVTAHVLRETRQVCGFPELDEARRRALGYLMRSRYPVYPHLFSFYPHSEHPFWMGGVLYADADDTSVIALELVRHDKRPAEILAYVAENYLLPYRATDQLHHHVTQPWHREGVFLTWFTTADMPNLIDCGVNTNVVAMLGAANLKHIDGYRQACDMINDAVAWADGQRGRLRQLTPYYPHAIEFYYALEHAVASGADELQPAWDALARVPWLVQVADGNDLLPLFSHEDGDIFWTADVVRQARQLKRLFKTGDTDDYDSQCGKQKRLCRRQPTDVDLLPKR